MRTKKEMLGLTVSTGILRQRITDSNTETLSALKKKTKLGRLRSRSQYVMLNEKIAKARRTRKIEHRMKEKKAYTARKWADPAPSNLIAKLDAPKVKSKYQSYFEFAENPEKKEKKLEFEVTTNVEPPLGYVFVPIGDPALTNACKELSREDDAMIYIVSNCKEDHSKISEHIYRIGFHFKEKILKTALKNLGWRELYNLSFKGHIEPIPESQQDINKQADAAIRDLFPRIPNTDREKIIEHAFKKARCTQDFGAMYQGEPTVGTQSHIPLSRRVQLAVLAHIRHNHTRYDKLLRETTWMNARKAVEPVCLDIILKWRGNEENGRDQMDEILREVVIITDSESENENKNEQYSTDEEAAFVSCGPSKTVFESSSRDLRNNFSFNEGTLECPTPMARSAQPLTTGSRKKNITKSRDGRARRGFKRYQAAWEEALHRQQEPSISTHHRIVSGYLPRRRNSLDNKDLYLGLSTQESTTNDSMNQTPFYNLQDRQRKIDHDFYMHPPHTNKYSMILGQSKYDNEELRNPNSESSIHFQNLTYQTSTNRFSHQRRLSPQLMVRHGWNNTLVESIEIPSDMIVPTHIEDRFSDRLNYNQNPHRRCSGEMRHHVVESIEAASNEILSPRIEKYFFNGLNNTQNSNLQLPDAPMKQGLQNRQVIIIDDDCPRAGNRHLMYYHESDGTKKHHLCSQDVYSGSQVLDSGLNTIPSLQPRDFFANNSINSSEFHRKSSFNVRSTHLDSVSISDPQTYSRNTPMYSLSHATHSKVERIKSKSKSHIEIVDLTSQEPTLTSNKYPCRTANENFRKNYRVAEQNNYVNIYGHHKSLSPLVSTRLQACNAKAAVPYPKEQEIPTHGYNYSRYNGQNSYSSNNLVRFPHK